MLVEHIPMNPELCVFINTYHASPDKRTRADNAVISCHLLFIARVGYRVKRKQARKRAPVALHVAPEEAGREGLSNESENLFHSLSRYANTSKPSFTVYESQGI